MTVIARLPGLEAGGHDRSASDVEQVRGPGDPRPPGRARNAPGESRFPAASTLLLAALAGACWIAVWWQERERVTATPTTGAGVQRDVAAPDAGAEPDAEGTGA